MASRGPRYFIDIEHSGLNKYQRITGSDRHVVEARAAAKEAEWAEQWARRLERENARASRESDRQDKILKREREQAYRDERKSEAEALTDAARQALNEAQGILAHTLGVNDAVDFDSLKDRRPFPDPAPEPKPMTEPPRRPDPTLNVYVPRTVGAGRRLWELLSRGSKRRRLAREAEDAERIRRENETKKAEVERDWVASCNRVAVANETSRRSHEAAVTDWMNRRAEYERKQYESNTAIDLWREAYRATDPAAVEQYCEFVLTSSEYPEWAPQSFELRYEPDSKVVVVEYVLPTPENVPTLKAVRWGQSQDEMVESHISDAERNRLYDSVVYQIALRTIHELFEADTVGAVDSVAFNGVVETIDRSNGRAVRPCIASVQAQKSEFLEVNLASVDPKACFRKLKGIGSAQLNALAAVAPIAHLRRDDERFIEGRQVIDGVEGLNLAAMDWEDFEHLIRDLFEREFSSAGGEVKVTRASRDGGIDAVVFDPDPIRGGKYVIQAKRYTGVVGVSAVRDLFGTMQHEGAAKGILVTTSVFGADSYGFAKDKPITLLDGSNLLHLLQKHGTKAHIDLKAAKAALKAEQQAATR